MSFEVDFEPIGQRVPYNSGETILDAAQRAGIVLNATCGGDGVCGRCIFRVMDGLVTLPNLTEEAELGGQVKDGSQKKVVHLPHAQRRTNPSLLK